MTDFKRPTRWSYSSLSTYQQCPQKWKFSYIDDLPWAASAAMTRGTRMHKMAEEYVKGEINFCPPEIKKIGPTLEMFKTRKAKPEVIWLLNESWEPVKDHKDAWIKTIVDIHYKEGDVLYVKDYKSGQMYDSHRDQLELYGLVGLQMYPDIKRVETSALYMDTGYEGMEGSMIRAMLPKVIKKWHDQAVIMMKDETFEPRPGNCKWCDYAKAKGGPCLY